jgi:hypothetical protein
MIKPTDEIREIRPDGLLKRDRTVPYPISDPNRIRTVPVTVSVPRTVDRAAYVRKDNQCRAFKAENLVLKAALVKVTAEKEKLMVYLLKRIVQDQKNGGEK